MACPFPGASTIPHFWKNLTQGIQSVQKNSREDLLNHGFTESEINDPHFIPSFGLLEGAAHFDAEFFGYSPIQAELLDPQQRLFLQCA